MTALLAATLLFCDVFHANAAEPPITAAALAPGGKHVVVGSQAGVAVYSWPKLERVRELPTRLAHLHALAFSPDGATLAIAGGSPSESGGFELIAWPEATSVASFNTLTDVAHDIAWLDDGRQLALACHDGKIVLSDLRGEKLQPLIGHSRPVLALAVLPGGQKDARDRNPKLLASGSSDQSLRVWDWNAGQLERTLANHTGDVRDLALRPVHAGPPLVASAGADKTVRFWQPTIGRLVRFARLKSAPLCIDFTPDGELLLAACEDGRLRAIDPETTELVFDTPAMDGWATLVLAGAKGSALVGGERGQLKMIQFDSKIPSHPP